MNKARGESEAIDAKTEDLFEAQELYATALGLRNDAPVMRCGGMVRKKRPFGGYASPYSLTGVSAPKLTTLPPIQTTASAGGGSTFKFGFNEFGLGMNLASSLFGIVGNALNTRANRKAIEFESTLHVPKGNKVDAVNIVQIMILVRNYKNLVHKNVELLDILLITQVMFKLLEIV